MSLQGFVLRGLDRLLQKTPEKFWAAPRVNGQPLSPLLQVMLSLRGLRPTPPESALSPAEVRAQLRRDALPLRKGYAVGAVRNLNIALPGCELRARHYRPRAESLPMLLLYFHGGGYVIGDLDTHDDVCRLLCREMGVQVLSVDYRLAPEHPCPAALEDAADVLAWARARAAEFGVRPEAIAMGGDSAGGNISAVVAQQQSQAATPLLAQLLIYPGTDLPSERPSRREFAQGYFLDAPLRQWFYDNYLQDSAFAPDDARVSPLRAELKKAQSPALMVTAAFDMLRDEGEAYAEALRAAGGVTDCWRAPALGHGFVNLVGVHGVSEQAVVEIARRFQRLCRAALRD